MGTVVSAAKQWWLKVNNKPMRTHALDGAVFPYIIKVKYTVDGERFHLQKMDKCRQSHPGARERC